jgi:hypothetical protein
MRVRASGLVRVRACVRVRVRVGVRVRPVRVRACVGPQTADPANPPTHPKKHAFLEHAPPNLASFLLLFEVSCWGRRILFIYTCCGPHV